MVISRFHERTGKLAVLDGLRGIAAVYVLIGHARWLLSQPYQTFRQHPEQYTWADKIGVFIAAGFRYGHEMVILFFVLSGFLIHLQQLNGKAKKSSADFINIKSYLIKRVLRIYPTLLLSMAISWVSGSIIMQINSSHDANADFTVKTFAENFFLIPTGKTWGNNGPMWSLRHEWFFYIIYPALLFLSRKRVLLPAAVAFLLFFCGLLNYQVPYIGEATFTLIIWWLGAALAEAYVAVEGYRLSILRGACVPAVILAFVVNPGPFRDLGMGIFFVGIIAILLTKKTKAVNGTILKFRFLGDFSYSIYILHFPLLLIIRELIIKNTKRLPNHLWFAAGAVIIVLPIIYLLFLLVEKPSLKLKSIIFK